MSIAYCCILIAALLPYVWTVVAKSSGDRRFDNRNPREWLASQDNPRVARANAAQLNAFEAFAPFAAGVVLAQLAGVDSRLITWLAVGFVIFRALHGLLYVANRATLRSLAWAGGFVCVVWLLTAAALQI
jgi:uncharacterized MAPEG superfamily protein